MRREAIGHFSELLRLNPNDNQGARYELATCLLEEGDDDALAGLLSRYARDGSAVWHYSRALLRFRQEGESPAAEAALQEAFEENPLVPNYLLEKKKIPARMPDFMSRGERSEAVVYAADNMHAWKQTPGALAWVEKKTKTARKSKAP
jgi:tetratricopeptide (TPR) repeat protein